MEYLHGAPLGFELKGKGTQTPVTDMIGDIELTIGFIIKRSIGCTGTSQLNPSQTMY